VRTGGTPGDVGVDGDAVGVVGDVVGVTLPVQATPLSVKLVGVGLLALFHPPLKPNEVLPFVARLPL
jgi:hypothetical protein